MVGNSQTIFAHEASIDENFTHITSQDLALTRFPHHKEHAQRGGNFQIIFHGRTQSNNAKDVLPRGAEG